MYPDFRITITRRPAPYFVLLPLCIGTMLGLCLIRAVAEQFLKINERSPAYNLLTTAVTLGALFGAGYIAALAPQGKLEFHDKKLRASMLFRKTRVFDLSETTITLEQWIGPGSAQSGPMGPMLVFDQGQTHFRIGCYDYDAALLLTPVKMGEWLTREPHGATKCVDFYALAQLLGVQIPKPAGWKLREVL